MSILPDPREGRSGARSAQRRSEERSAWFALASKMFIAETGGVWPEQPVSAHYRRVLDVNCGTGDWLAQAASMYPAIQKCYGVDENRRLIVRARVGARERGLDERLEFHVMDALRMLEFPFDYLDLVSIQLGSRSIRTWEWSKLLHECRRVTRTTGVIRAVEQDFIAESTSPAFNRLMQLLVRTSYQAGHLFAPVHNGLLAEMPRLFDQFGVRNVQTRAYSLALRATTPDWQDFARSLLFTMTPFVAKWLRLPEDYEALCQQALLEIAQPDFRAQWKLLVVWGEK